jgi:hypothetical protein
LVPLVVNDSAFGFFVRGQGFVRGIGIRVKADKDKKLWSQLAAFAPLTLLSLPAQPFESGRLA